MLEYEMQGGGREQMVVDMKELTFRPHKTRKDDWFTKNDYSLIKQGSIIDVYWEYEGSWYSCKVK